MERFTPFWSGPFSQWSPSPFQIDGVWYNCAEQYMMAEKARLFGDAEREAMIMSATDPADQKRYGRQVQGFDKAVWEAHAKNIVRRATRAKYAQNERHRKALLATAGTTLVEASPSDKIWGVGLHPKDGRVHDRANWQGLNWLGEVLTEVRDEMIAAT